MVFFRFLDFLTFLKRLIQIKTGNVPGNLRVSWVIPTTMVSSCMLSSRVAKQKHPYQDEYESTPDRCISNSVHF